ncbi:hypothetical protein QAD02_015577 [Eretmocerus hayati]|uniref:Uncharacterized protein n=1 Tax=Eretmocerus hayati TaxID=131215 RepID=A0ACC2P8Q4_9HYME|nr:hypothetical protein QAD02_015577 [Eretmocerus hayati]
MMVSEVSFTVIWAVMIQALLLLGAVQSDEAHLISYTIADTTEQVTVITKSRKSSNSIPQNVISSIMKKVPANYISEDDVDQGLDQESAVVLQKLLTFNHRQQVLIFVDAMIMQDVIPVMLHSLKVITGLTGEKPRPKCTLIVINVNQSKNYHEFFKLAWLDKFLHLDVIEILKTEIISPPNILNYFVRHDEANQMTINRYNPFDDSYLSSYYREPYLGLKNSRSGKILNAQRYPLNAAVKGATPFLGIIDDYNGDNALDALVGPDVITARAISQSLNFTLVIKVIDSPRNHLPRLNVTQDNYFNNYKLRYVDFDLGICSAIGFKNSNDSSHSYWSTFLFPYSNWLVVKKPIAVKDSLSFVHMIFVLFIIGVAKIGKVRLVFKIIIGSTVRSRRFSEKMFFVSLTLGSFFFSANVVQYFVGICIPKIDYIELNSFKDVLAHPNIQPYLGEETKAHATRITSDDVLLKLIKKSKSVDSLVGDHCIITLMMGKNDEVQACEMPSLLGLNLAENLPKEIIRPIKIIQEPIASGWAVLQLNPSTPYGDSFDKVLRRLFESGLINYWWQNARSPFWTSVIKKYENKQVHKKKISDTWIYMVFPLAICYFISFLVFLSEILLHRYQLCLRKNEKFLKGSFHNKKVSSE